MKVRLRNYDLKELIEAIFDKNFSNISTNKEIEAIIAEKISEVIADAPEDFDTLKEIADWIKSDTTGAAKMQADILELTKNKADFDHTHTGYLASIPAASKDVLGGVKMYYGTDGMTPGTSALQTGTLYFQYE